MPTDPALPPPGDRTFDVAAITVPEARRRRIRSRLVGGVFVVGVAGSYALLSAARGQLPGFGWVTTATLLGLAAAVGLGMWGLPYTVAAPPTSLAVGPNGIVFSTPHGRPRRVPIDRPGSLVLLWEPTRPTAASLSGEPPAERTLGRYWVGTGYDRRIPVPPEAYRAVETELRRRGLRELSRSGGHAPSPDTLRLFRIPERSASSE